MPDIDIEHLAKLAKLPITREEKKDFVGQLDDVLKFVSQIKGAKSKHLIVDATITGLVNVTREDKKVQGGLLQKQALANAPSTKDGYFRVKAIFD